MFQHNTPCRPQLPQQLALPSSLAPHVRKLRSRRPYQLPGPPLMPPQLSAVLLEGLEPPPAQWQG